MKKILIKSLLGISAISLLTTSFSMNAQASTDKVHYTNYYNVEYKQDQLTEEAPIVQRAFPLAIPVVIWGARGAQLAHKMWKAGKLVTVGSAVVISSMTAQEIIGKYKKGAINKEFPGNMKDKTLEEIDKLAKKGNKDAKKAKKLLTDKRFDKGDNRK